MNPPRPPKERFQLVFEAQPCEVAAVIRLRTLLKRALRTYALKCLSAIQLPDDAPTPANISPQEPAP